MRKVRQVQWSRQILSGAMLLVFALAMGIAFWSASFVSHAESKGKVTASTSVNIRKEPNTSSASVGSADKDAEVDIRGQVSASDGTVWYQVFVNAETLGYVRSDLVQITDGSTPPTVEVTTSQTTTTTQTPASNETPVDVTAVEPMSATVTNGERVRVRSNASTTSSIVTSAQSGMALTVTGQANGTDGKVWYQVEFIANGANVVGFIRSDYVSLSGELVPAGSNTDNPSTETPAPETPQEPEAVTEPEVTKTWDTQQQGEAWYLLNLEEGNQYEITKLFEAVEANGKLYEDSQKTVSSQKVVIIILVILLIVLAAAATLLFMKIKDMNDSAYFEEVEREALRRKTDNRPKNNQKVVHTVGPDKKPGAQPQGNRPQGARPAGAQPQGNKPQGARPAGAQPQGNRPQGAKPAGAQPQSGKPQGAKPVVPQPQSRPTEAPKPANTQQQSGWKSKNFMTDDDEFEFEFLNWDGDEE